jgi:hypothetical protein
MVGVGVDEVVAVAFASIISPKLKIVVYMYCDADGTVVVSVTVSPGPHASGV